MAQRPTVELAEPQTAEFRCLACALSFSTLDELKVHYKQEFHRANLQRKVSGLGPISAEEFERRLGQHEVRNSGRALLVSSLACSPRGKLHHYPSRVIPPPPLTDIL